MYFFGVVSKDFKWLKKSGKKHTPYLSRVFYSHLINRTHTINLLIILGFMYASI